MSKPISLVLSGYYGFDNAGDEAVLMSILQQLKRIGVTPIVLSGNPTKTTETYGVRAVHRMKLADVTKAIKESDGLISGGGSLLQDITSIRSVFYYLGVMKIAQYYHKPVFCYAQGVGPLRRKWIHPIVRSVLNQCEWISVRDPHSKTLLKKIGVTKPIELTADPAIGLQNEGYSSLDEQMFRFLQKRPLVLSVRNWENNEMVVRNMATLIKKLRNKQIPVLLLPFHSPHDTIISQQIKQHFQYDQEVVVVENAQTVKDFIYIVNNGYVMVGMRLHALVFAASQGIPFVGVSYDPKIDSFLELFGSSSATNTNEWNMDAVYEQICWIYEHYDEEVKKIDLRLGLLHEKIDRPISYIRNYFKEELHDNLIRNQVFYSNNERNRRNIK